MDVLPGHPEPPEGSILLSLLDDWQWLRVRGPEGVGWQPVHLIGRPVVLQTWEKVRAYAPFEVIRWGPGNDGVVPHQL